MPNVNTKFIPNLVYTKKFCKRVSKTKKERISDKF